MDSKDRKILLGTIKSWDSIRGFGFAKRADGQGDIFVHISDVLECSRKGLAVSTKIAFSIGRDVKTGRRTAANVHVTGEVMMQRERSA